MGASALALGGARRRPVLRGPNRPDRVLARDRAPAPAQGFLAPTFRQLCRHPGADRLHQGLEPREAALPEFCQSADRLAHSQRGEGWRPAACTGRLERGES